MAKELLAIQYLRGIAALMVVVVHIPVQLSRMGFNGDWPEFLNIGVDIFFVISGFIMWTTTFDGRVGVAQFLSRRLVRIAPLYWALTSITVLVMLAAPTLVQSGKLDLQHVITSYLFVASQHPVTQLMEPILVPGWTLNYEMFFYVVFAFCLPLRASFRAMAVVAILVTLVALQVFVPERHTIASFYTSSIILEFGFGVLLGVLFTAGYSMPGRAALALLAFGCLGIGVVSFYGELPRVVSLGVPAALIVAGAVMYERRHDVGRIWLLRLLGDASYSLYLSHGIVLSAAGQAWRRLGATELPFSHALFSVVSLIVVSAVAVLVYRLIERPLLDTFRKRRSAEFRQQPTSAWNGGLVASIRN